MSEYLTKLEAFKDLIARYTIADLRSMIYEIEVKPSGDCCYPAVQTLFSLMELIGKLIAPNVTDEGAFTAAFVRLGETYNNEVLANKLYKYFRNGIAHNSLAKGGVQVKKSGDTTFHLSNGGNNIDIKIIFEDFEPVFHDIFDNWLRQEKYIPEYEKRLRSIFGELNIRWGGIDGPWGDLDSSCDYSRTGLDGPSGTCLPMARNSGASTTRVENVFEKNNGE